MAVRWNDRGRALRVVAAAIAVLLLMPIMAAARGPAALQAAGTVVSSGTVDNDRVAGPRWTGATFTPASSGDVELVLSWSGGGDLALSVYEVSSNSWVGSNIGTAGSPKSLTVDLDAGVSYRMGVWSRSGVGTFELAVAGDGPPPTTTTTTTTSTPPDGGTVVSAGTVDADRVTGPRWTGATFTPASSGDVDLVLSWSGGGDLSVSVYVVSSNSWVGSNTATAGSPKSLTVDLDAGVSYRVGVWSRSGTGAFEVTIGAGGPPPPTTTTTTTTTTVPVDPPSGDQPNILVINLDDARPEGLEVLPKTLEWFADDGTSYSNAFVTTPSCCPSRATLMTGQYVHNNGQIDQNTPLTDETISIQRYLQDAGYFTAHAGKYLHYYSLMTQAPYWDRWAYYKGSYIDVPFNIDGNYTRNGVYSTINTFDQAIDQIESFDALDDSAPFYLHVAPTAPHSPFDPEPQYENAPVPTWNPAPSVAESNRSDKPPWVRWLNVTESEASVIRAGQLRLLMSVDDQVDRLMTRLEELGELDNTIAIFTSDNGYFWGEHGRRGKFLPYDEANRVPFIVRWPGEVAAGANSADLVSHVDILPTVLSAAGVNANHTVDGRDILSANFSRANILTEYWLDPANNNGVPDWASIRNVSRVYTEYYDDDGSVLFREYYDLTSDPYELVNLLNDGNSSNDPDTAADEAALDAAYGCAGASCP